MAPLKIVIPILVFLLVVCQLMGLELVASIRNTLVGGIGSYLGALLIIKAYANSAKEYSLSEIYIHQIALSFIAVALLLVGDKVISKFEIDPYGVVFLTGPFILLSMLIAMASCYANTGKPKSNKMVPYIFGLLGWGGAVFVYIFYMFNTHGT